MEAGSTFLLTELDKHLWIVLSDPKLDDTKVLLVSLTTAHHLKESVCLLEVGDHPWVRHQTCVNYQDAKVVSLKKLYELKDKGLLRLQEPLTADAGASQEGSGGSRPVDTHVDGARQYPHRSRVHRVLAPEGEDARHEGVAVLVQLPEPGGRVRSGIHARAPQPRTWARAASRVG
jgi:hypothetical protein